MLFRPGSLGQSGDAQQSPERSRLAYGQLYQVHSHRIAQLSSSLLGPKRRRDQSG
jgi:hypothetical protein